ncbi:MAG: hypothetical protein QOD98_4401 [Nocardioidaceae bacterium]|jgi:hypothetical protein|nr:hypothetical protein [Nocardioidaceae bacterium]
MEKPVQMARSDYGAPPIGSIGGVPPRVARPGCHLAGVATSVTIGTPARVPVPSSVRPVARLPFVITTFVGSFLLFQVQPMVARMALPELGGAPAVWNSAMLVYQAVLLAGYAWAHWLSRFPVRRQVLAHLVLLLGACLWLPIGLASFEPPTGNSVVLFVPMLLLVSVGPVLLAVSAQAPLVQQWFASGRGANPYPLYAASNLGSFTGLLAYPLVVEPLLRLDTQRWGWTAGYGVLVLLVGGCGFLTVHALGHTTAMDKAAVALSDRSPLTHRSVITWIVLSAVPSGLMLSTTTHLSTDIMAMPLLWAIPLGLYLLSFTVAFASRRGAARVITRFAPALLLIFGASALMSGGTANYVAAALSVVTLFAVAVALHSRLYDSRPPVQQLTSFYLITAVGGALGGVFCGLVAPLAFDWVYEHPILVLAAGGLIPLRRVSKKFDPATLPVPTARVVRAVLLVLVAVLSTVLSFTSQVTLQMGLLVGLWVIGVMTWSWRRVYLLVLLGLMCGLGARSTLPPSFNGHRDRSYFGVYTVIDDTRHHMRLLVHGGTTHGIELTTPGMERTPTAYYGPDSGIGLVMNRAPDLFGADASIGVVGLGAGTLACYAQPGQSWRFFEIDPVVVRIARDSGQFHFLRDCTPDATMTVGDARLELGKVPKDSFDLLAVDAFSSDAIPMHLMTREAFDVYDRVVRDDGLVLVHITNRFIDLEPVLRALVERQGWSAAVHASSPSDSDMRTRAYAPSLWVAMSRTPGALDGQLVEIGGTWRPLADGEVRPWSDDFASVLPLLK